MLVSLPTGIKKGQRIWGPSKLSAVLLMELQCYHSWMKCDRKKAGTGASKQRQGSSMHVPRATASLHGPRSEQSM